jgi:hypothetical protein
MPLNPKQSREMERRFTVQAIKRFLRNGMNKKHFIE